MSSSGPRTTNWADSWYNRSRTQQRDQNNLLTQWKYYQEQLRRQNASRLIYTRPWIGSTVVPPASAYAVGLYRGEIMEMIKDDPQLLNELVNQVGSENLTKALEFARVNPMIAYGAPNNLQFQDFAARKAAIYADLNLWIRDLARRQDSLVYGRTGGQTYWTLPSGYTGLTSASGAPLVDASSTTGSSLRAGAQVSLGGAVSLLMSLLIIVGIAGGVIFMYQRYRK